jgi:hypothetical protein
VIPVLSVPVLVAIFIGAVVIGWTWLALMEGPMEATLFVFSVLCMAVAAIVGVGLVFWVLASVLAHLGAFDGW